ncbi:hypothetical protein K1T71_004740 [Dendrolimus kikuchii]|uniref:Uncharacterized protein n=1 Tax=Dendrolimus kikuchii TaxID=765133 RepID=A0ACC1D897_9NEOP|nr:hypothetical protein K1T71_004740 [Dendrolimus kikuchii]
MARVLLALVFVACVHQAAPRPVKKTLNFHMFVLRPKHDQPDRFFIATDGVSRFGPVLEYFVQRVQGMMSVKVPENHNKIDAFPEESEINKPVSDAENEVDSVPGVVVRPSSTKPGTYEVEIDVMVDDGQPDEKKQ